MAPFKTISLNVSADAIVGTTLSAGNVIYAQGGNSNLWNSTYTTVQANSASWEESAEILPTVTNYLSTNNVLISGINVRGNIFTNQLSVSSRTVFSDQLYYTTDNKVSQLSALSGNYEEDQFLGRTKLTQNNTRLVNIGKSWIEKQIGVLNWYGITTSSDGKITTALSQAGGIYVSNDYGNTWVLKKSGGNNFYRVAMSSDGKYQLAGNNSLYLFRSEDYGDTWQEVLNDTFRFWYGVAVSSDGKYQSAVTFGDWGIFTSSDYGKTWILRQSLPSIEFVDIAMSSDGKYQTATSYSGGLIYVSRDYGVTWASKAFPGEWIFCSMSSDGKYQATMIENGRIYISNDYGETWAPRESIRAWFDICMSSNGKVLVATTSTNDYMYISNDYGYTWLPKKNNNAGSRYGVTISSDAKYIFVTENARNFISVSKADELLDGNLTVTSDLSVASTINTSNHGSSTLWNSTYTTVQANSASWQAATTVVQNNSAIWVPEDLAIAYAIAL